MTQQPTITIEVDKPPLALSQVDGNAMSILAAARRAARRANWTPQQEDALHAQAVSGSYQELLQLMHKHFDVS